MQGTLWILAKATRKIRDAIDKCIPKQVSTVKYEQRKNGIYERKECSEDDGTDDWEFMKATEKNRSKLQYELQQLNQLYDRTKSQSTTY